MRFGDDKREMKETATMHMGGRLRSVLVKEQDNQKEPDSSKCQISSMT